MGLGRCMHATVTDDVKELRLDVEGRDMSAQRVALMQQLADRLYLWCDGSAHHVWVG